MLISREDMGNSVKRNTPNDAQHSQSSKENIDNTWMGEARNIIINHDFSGGLQPWYPNFCKAFVISSDSTYGSSHYVILTNRSECWQGLEQDITGRVCIDSTYRICASVSVSGVLQDSADVQGTLKLEYQNYDTKYMFIARRSVAKDKWEKLEGTFLLSTLPDRLVFYLEGPPPGVDLLIQSVLVHNQSSRESLLSNDTDDSITLNPTFDNGLSNWSGRGCKIDLHDSMSNGKILPFSRTHFASATERTHSCNGIQQDITLLVKRKLAYKFTTVVRIIGNGVTNSVVSAKLCIVHASDNRQQYIDISSVQATDKEWVTNQGKFLIEGSPKKVLIYLEGPPPGTDILVDSFVVKHVPEVPPSLLPVIENPGFGVNIIVNSNLTGGTTNGWFPRGNCTLSVAEGSPRIIPPMARDYSLGFGFQQPLSGRYILVTNRSETQMGCAQTITTDRLKLYLTYQVSAWVRIGLGATYPQIVRVVLDVDGQCVNGGQVEVCDETWHEIGGSFRIEKQHIKVVVYVQGPTSGIGLMIAGLQIFPVDRKARFKHLKVATDKIRKRDVILKLSGLDPGILPGSFIRLKQTQNSFPFGSYLSRSNIENEDLNEFFVKNFNWAVFGNELKWYWTEPQQGNFNYKDADELLNFCTSHNIQCRCHCIFSEVDDDVPLWVHNLNVYDLKTAVKNRLKGFLSRYKGKFSHYDTRAYMFKAASLIDSYPILFVNDYNVEDDRCDGVVKSSPVGGIGIKGHMDSPVGPIVCSVLDKLGILGLPIWFTELDVVSNNEYIRADDLEVMLRELYAHPAVDGVVLFGFWELLVRENGHLVNAEGDLNEAGRRYLGLKDEWLTHANGHFDEQGEFLFRGFHGSYEVEFVCANGKITRTFNVEKGEEELVVPISL